ncbi:hypothetical protein E2C01_086907 [Portunus trituberculatus]|uniref:Uncharacterized protein n=1 Tax=Portunus trituberculatus TaxID=210409 RepID=A0A5B7JCN4_PORTR|nr:hypothetical protein [Portunus trituberculatus]
MYAMQGCPTGASWRWWRHLCYVHQPLSMSTLPQSWVSAWSMIFPVQVSFSPQWSFFRIFFSKASASCIENE